MTRQRSEEMTWKDFVPSCVAGVLTVAVVVLCALNYNSHGLNWLLYLGWVVWAIGFVLCVTPMHVLRRKGRVAHGESWVRTTIVVDSGPYAIVRHPVYVGWMVMVLALALISQYWVIAVCDAVAITLVYFDIWREDRDNVEKFGDAYREYQQSVPMVNLPLGVIGVLRRRRRA